MWITISEQSNVNHRQRINGRIQSCDDIFWLGVGSSRQWTSSARRLMAVVFRWMFFAACLVPSRHPLRFLRAMGASAGASLALPICTVHFVFLIWFLLIRCFVVCFGQSIIIVAPTTKRTVHFVLLILSFLVCFGQSIIIVPPKTKRTVHLVLGEFRLARSSSRRGRLRNSGSHGDHWSSWRKLESWVGP